MNVEEARARLGLDGPSPARRALANKPKNKKRKQKGIGKHPKPEPILTYENLSGVLYNLDLDPKRKGQWKQHFKNKQNKNHKPQKQKKSPKTPPKPPIDMPRYATGDLRVFIFTRDVGQCQYCGIEISFEECNIDHVLPWPLGWTIEENLVVACQPCNKLKYTQIIPKHLRPI